MADILEWVSALAMGAISALVPLVNLEIYVAAVSANESGLMPLMIGIMAGAGQTLGKIAWYYAGRGGMESSWLRNRRKSQKSVDAIERWLAKFVGRPLYPASILLVSASVGFPPLLVIAVVCGAARLRLDVFIVVCFIGRAIRFTVIAYGAEALCNLARIQACL